MRCTCSKLCEGKNRKISLLHTAAVLRSYSRVPSTPKNLCVVIVGCRRRMFQQEEIVSIKLVTGKNIGPPSSKGLWFVWKGYFIQLCILMESKVYWTLNSNISNNSAVYQTMMEELVCAVQRNGLTLTLNHNHHPKLYSLAPYSLWWAHCVVGRMHGSPVALCLVSGLKMAVALWRGFTWV